MQLLSGKNQIEVHLCIPYDAISRLLASTMYAGNTMTAQTLLDMAGAPRMVPALADAALVIIDAQEEYRSGALPLVGIEEAIEALTRLLAAARAAGSRIIHIAHAGRPGGLFDLSARGGAFISGLTPENNETVMEKKLPNAFHGTPLDETLKAAGAAPLILAGFQSHMCLSSTARAALDLGYTTSIIAEATASRDLPLATGNSDIPASIVQTAALAALADRFARVFSIAEVTPAGPADSQAQLP
jgi:nicotinamidase-related amidase